MMSNNVLKTQPQSVVLKFSNRKKIPSTKYEYRLNRFWNESEPIKLYFMSLYCLLSPAEYHEVMEMIIPKEGDNQPASILI